MYALLLLCAAGCLAGAMNALAGGGSFVSLPAMIAVGVPSVVANASSTVALYPGGAAAVWVYRDGLNDVCGVPLKITLTTTVSGGFVGALLLLLTSSAFFDRILPWLLLAASLTLAFAPALGAAFRARFRAGLGAVLIVQFLLGIYGGYFGGAVGLMMMAAWSLLDGRDLKSLNPTRALMTTAANAVAMLCFILAGVVRWPETLALGAGAIAGGYGGARLGRVLPARVVRVGTVVFAFAMTAIFFARAYG